MGVWIEIEVKEDFNDTIESLPAWECGLKYRVKGGLNVWDSVTPCVGVWIEIKSPFLIPAHGFCHSLRGSVD